jgi:4'-phosphopantetheinyl transferase
MLLSANEVDVWYHELTAAHDPVVVDAETLLSQEERARRDRFLFPRDRQAFTAAHALVRSALSLYEPTKADRWQFDKGEHGKPAIVREQAGYPPLKFNLSHTREIVAVAITRGAEVGVDVERICGTVAVRDVPLQCFTAHEMRMLAACDSDHYAARFIELWTLKEAYSKATGLGLSYRLDSFGFDWESGTGLRFWPGERDGEWRFVLTAIGHDYRLAVAIQRIGGELPIVDFREWANPGNRSRLKVLNAF